MDIYSASSYLQFRTDFASRHFSETPKERYWVANSQELEEALARQVRSAAADGKAAIALSGGIDSAVLARFMPRESVAYTFKCVIPGVQVVDEVPNAARYAAECGLQHRIIEIYWEDIEAFLPDLMSAKQFPVHSIEVQIYKAALRAKTDGFDRIIFGESADCLYGGLNQVLSRDWTFGDFVERYSYVMPYKVLKRGTVILAPFEDHVDKNGFIDVHGFYQDKFFKESTASYINATRLAGVEAVMPYAHTRMISPLDYARVRAGENKYLVREVFNKLYPGFAIPAKTPMPRPTNEWFKLWNGPVREEFWPNCISGMSGDQKWLVYCLEQYMNMFDGGLNREGAKID